MRIDAHKVTNVSVTGQWSVQVPAGAAPDGAAVAAHPLKAADLAAITPADVPGLKLLQAADVTLSSGQPAAPLTFTFRLRAPLPNDQILFLIDETAKSATVLAAARGSADPVPATVHVAQLSADRTTGTVTVPHLSLTSWWTGFAANLTQAFGQLTGQRNDPPDCPNPYPSWMTQLPVFLDDGNAPIRVCVQRDTNDPATAVVKIRNNRGAFLRITSPITPSWAWQSMFGSDVQSWMNDLTRLAMQRVGVPADELSRSWLVPPGGEVDIGVSQQAVAAQNPLTIRAHENVWEAAGGLLYSLLGFASSKDPVFSLALFGLCADTGVAPAADGFDTTGLAHTAYNLANCVLGDPKRVLSYLREKLPKEAWGRVAPLQDKLTAAAGKVAWFVGIAQLGFIGLDVGASLLTQSSSAGAWTISLFPPFPVSPNGVTPVAYRPYGNARYDFWCDVPADWPPGRESDNSDGLTVHNPAGTATLLCYGANNDAATIADAQANGVTAATSEGDTVIYAPRPSSTAFTISGTTKGGLIFYQHTLWGPGSTVTVYWTYPPALRASLDPLVIHTEQTLSAHALAVSH